jgi:ATP-dependent Clp protease ATP-binding subunit ClpA
MRLLRRRRVPTGAEMRPAEPYLLAGAREARRLASGFVGTEHVLSAMIRDPERAAAVILRSRGITAAAVEEALAPWLGCTAARIDPSALAALGIDLDAVRERLDATFGADALETTGSGCLGIAPRLKRSLVFAVDAADGGPLTDRHVLLGFLSEEGSVAARVLARLGVTPADAAG